MRDTIEISVGAHFHKAKGAVFDRLTLNEAFFAVTEGSGLRFLRVARAFPVRHDRRPCLCSRHRHTHKPHQPDVAGAPITMGAPAGTVPIQSHGPQATATAPCPELHK